jgi:hypothetical protein
MTFPTVEGPAKDGASFHASPEEALKTALTWGRHRWVVERILARFSCYRRLTIRYECRADIYLAASLICLNFVRSWFR